MENISIKPEIQNLIDMSKGTKYASKAYPQLVEYLIEQRYTIKQELSINRQKDEKPTQWQEYNAYCESCKAEAKRLLGIE